MTAPERIWAWPWEVNPTMGQWETERSIAGEGTEYVRADLPPTLSAALELPEIKTLVEASKGLLFAHDHGNGLEGWHNTRERLRIALRAIEDAT